MLVHAGRIGNAMRAAIFLSLSILAACSGLKNPGTVADQFMDRYYVESDQAGALKLTTGLASLKLKDELGLSAEGRAPGMQLVSRQVRVYYTRKALGGSGDARTVDYALDIRPQGGGEIKRTAHLELALEPDGSWRVARFTDSQPQG